MFYLSMTWRHMGGRGLAPLFLNLDIRWGWVVSFTLRLPHPPERTPVPTGWATQTVRTFRRTARYVFCPYRNSKSRPDCPTPTDPSRLSYSGRPTFNPRTGHRLSLPSWYISSHSPHKFRGNRLSGPRSLPTTWRGTPCKVRAVELLQH